MAIALLTNYLAPYRLPLYEHLAARHELEVLCFGRGERYVAPWLREQRPPRAGLPFTTRRLGGPADAFFAARRYEAVIAPFAGGSILPAAYLGARAARRPFLLWASVWRQPRSVAHALALPSVRRIYRDADAVLAYGEHVRRFVARTRGRDDDVIVAPQCVEADLFGAPVDVAQRDGFRARHRLPDGPLALYAGRLVAEKGVGVLLEAARLLGPPGRVVVAGAGPLADEVARAPGVHLLGALARNQLPVAYATCAFALLPSLPTRRFCEPWGLVCNEAMHQGRPVIASAAVGAVAGGLVRNGVSGLVVAPGDARALATAIERLASDARLRARLGAGARAAVAPYRYEAAAAAVTRALEIARASAARRAHRRPGAAYWPRENSASRSWRE
jgi:glycosyltransferase involved in cell wall biosynthesis